MPTCPRCQRRLRFWEADLFGGPCGRCVEGAARERETGRRETFTRSSALRRTWVGASRGALLGPIGLVWVGLTLLARLAGGDPGTRYPYPDRSPVWLFVSLGALAVAVAVGWWASSWWAGLAALIAVGVAGGAAYGAYQGLRGRWELFT